MKKTVARFILLGSLALAAFLAVSQPPQSYYPAVEVELSDASGMIVMAFLHKPRLRRSECEMISGNIGRTAIENCPQCRIRKLGCKTSLDEAERTLFGEMPIPMPSARSTDSIATFSATDPNMALSACQASETISARSPVTIKCHASNTPRIKPPARSILIPSSHLIMLLAAFATVWLTCWFIIRYEHLHAHISHDHVGSGPQKYHTRPTPRIGGLAIFFGLIAAGGIMLFEDGLISEYAFGLLIMAGIPAFLGGLTEDITKKVGVPERLLLTMLSGAVAAWLLGAVLNRLDIPGVDQALMWLPLAVVFTAFAVGGLSNAINIIDGYNGLASGFAVLVLAAMAYVAHALGDRLVFSTSLALAGALLGFIAWNWPSGRIFLGDGGAYLIGFILAELAVLIVVRNPNVSPWFPLLLLIYPIFETFYSIYRRKLKNNLSPGQPDNRHLHQLIHDYVIPHRIGGGKHFSRNSRVAKYVCVPAAVVAALGGLFWNSTPMLVACSICFCVLYIFHYRRIEAIASDHPDNTTTPVTEP